MPFHKLIHAEEDIIIKDLKEQCDMLGVEAEIRPQQALIRINGQAEFIVGENVRDVGRQVRERLSLLIN